MLILNQPQRGDISVEKDKRQKTKEYEKGCY